MWRMESNTSRESRRFVNTGGRVELLNAEHIVADLALRTNVTNA